MNQPGGRVGKHQANRVVVAPLAVGRQVRDDLVRMGASIVATRAIVIKTACFDSSSHP